MPTVPTAPPRDDRELAAYATIISDAFSAPCERSTRYIGLVGREQVRLVRRDGGVVGGLVLLPQGQFFGGRPVPQAGLAAVAVAPEHRAGGDATALLKAVLTELHAAGIALSSLYPATVKLYRRVGYELAGAACEVSLPARTIDLRDRTLAVRPATDADEAAVHALYADWARHIPGQLERIPFNWHRVHFHMDEPTQGYVIAAAGGPEGYAFLYHDKAAPGRTHVRVKDAVAATPAAARRLLTFLADYRTTRDLVLWRTGPADPLFTLLGETPYTLETKTPWMLRIVDVRAALATRGYPVGLAAELHLAVHDDVLPANSGRWVLEVAGGRGTVSPGGRGALELDIRGLAALYSGYQTPRDVVLAGRGQGDEAALATAGAIFAGPLPWMRDDF